MGVMKLYGQNKGEALDRNFVKLVCVNWLR